MITPTEARARLSDAREKMHLARMVHPQPHTIDATSGLIAAIDDLISLLEDALA